MDDRHCRAFLKVSEARSVEEEVADSAVYSGGWIFSKEKGQFSEKNIEPYRSLLKKIF